MSQLRWDPLKNDWVIVSGAARRRPHDFLDERGLSAPSQCPFCEGREDKCAGELYAARPPGSPPNGRGWQLRVIPNRLPTLRVEGDIDRRAAGLYDIMNGIGAHEVVIETPEHDRTMTDLDVDAIVNILRAWRARLLDLHRDRRFRYLMIFKNHGLEAGAVVAHAHSQVMALPLIPAAVRDELSACRDYFRRKERCLMCDIIAQERSEQSRIVRDDGSFVTYVPFAAAQPFEVRIAPRQHGHDFTNVADDSLLPLARALRDTMLRFRAALRDPPYNLALRTAPPPHPRPGRSKDWQSLAADFHWHLEIAPRLVRRGGFEWGTGLHVNPTPPEEAAAVLREADLTERN